MTKTRCFALLLLQAAIRRAISSLEPKGPADEEHQVALAAAGPTVHPAGQLLAGAHPALYAQGGQHGAGGQLGPDGVGLPGQRRVNLSLGRGIGQPFFLQLDYMEFTTPGKSFAVFFAGLAVKFFFQFSHTYERDVVHSCAPLQDMNGAGLAAGRHSQ